MLVLFTAAIDRNKGGQGPPLPAAGEDGLHSTPPFERMINKVQNATNICVQHIYRNARLRYFTKERPTVVSLDVLLVEYLVVVV